MQSDVPIALMLSGGMDSSLLLKTLKNNKKNIHPFTLGFQSFNGKENDEFKISKKYCDQLNIKLNKIHLLDEEILENLEHFFHHMDQPTYDGLNTFLITKYINQNHFKVALSGLGADEIFNGYNTLSRLKLLNSLRLFYNNFLFRKLIKFLGFIFNKNKLIKFFELLSNYNSPYQIYLLLRSKKNSLHKIENKYIDKILKDNKELNNFNFYDLVSLLESKIYMKNQLLKDVDWASMANSIEVRVPFVDYDLLKNFKKSNYKFFKKKTLFKKIFNLPKFITNKKKTGFEIPFKQIVDIYNKKYKTNYKDWSDICISEYLKSIS
jgi:asparagine synthase (glutamine-hydrolysing)